MRVGEGQVQKYLVEALNRNKKQEGLTRNLSFRRECRSPIQGTAAIKV